MRIGIDFDNTLISYEKLFAKKAVALGFAPFLSKTALRDSLRAKGEEALWVTLQEEVYAQEILAARAYPGAVAFVSKALEKGVSVKIVSHKSKLSKGGKNLDLRQAARAWLSQEGFFDLLSQEDVFFEEERSEKAARIGLLACDYFIDDLQELFAEENFPKCTKQILFSPDKTPWDSLSESLL